MRRTAGVVAAGSEATARSGAQMFETGGNAVDALCAAGFAAFVVEGLLASPAGGGAALIGDRDHGFELLDFFAAAPGLGLDKRPEIDFHGVDVSFGPAVQQFHVGRGSAAVPGALQGLLELHRRRGSLPLPEVVAPAIRLGREGFAVGGPMAFITSILAPILDLTPAVQAMFRPGGRNPGPDDRLTNPALADFLEQVGREGASVFEHVVAPAILRELGPDRGGLLTAEDLARYAPTWREPLAVSVGPHRLNTNPLPSSGGTLIALGLSLVEGSGLPGTAFGSAEHMLALADLLGALDRAKADTTGAPLPEAWLERARRNLGSTTHISVMDEHGEVAAMTMSNGEGCGYALAELGIHFNNFLGEEDINPGGFHRHAPGTWMTTMMAPTAVVGPNGPQLVLGSGGSNRIRSAILQGLVNVLLFERPLREAVTAARMHVEGSAVSFEEEGLPAPTLEALLRRFPDATRFTARNMFFGGIHAVAPNPLHGAGDPRRGGATARS